MSKAEPKPKYVRIDEDEPDGADAYNILQEARDQWCDHLTDCHIVLLWVQDVKPDKDGHVVLGKNLPVSEGDRELHGFDRKILLNRETWQLFSREQRLALVHHELLHTDEAVDQDGEPILDGHGKRKWRTVKHDIEEFSAVVRAHGCWKADLAKFAEAILAKDPQLNMFEREENAAPKQSKGTGKRGDAATAAN